MRLFPARNWRFMILAFFLAVGIWFYLFCDRHGISLVKPDTKELNVRIKIFKKPGVDIQERMTPMEAGILVRGSRDLLRDLHPSEVKAFVDLESLGVGKHSVPVQIDLPPGITLVSQSPSTVTVERGWDLGGEAPEGGGG